MKTSGDRASWLNAVADHIMDGGTLPPSVDRLCLIIPDRIVTAHNDGYNTAAAVFGESRRDDYKAGQRVIIEEMVETLRDQGFVNGDDRGLRWLMPLDGEWQVKLDDRSLTIRGQRERRLVHERNLLGERDEESGDRIGPAGILESGKARPFQVEVLGSRGGTKTMELQVHPFATLIPPMTERERDTLRESIAKDGVKMPLVLYQGRVLDGRNRLYFASVLKKPVQIKEFEGTEEEAKRYVFVLNLARRHLTPLQCAVAVINLFGNAAARETRLKKVQGYKKRDLDLPTRSREDTRREEWHYIVARKAREEVGVEVTPSTILLTKEVMSAPETKAAVERGEITTANEATRRARAEKGKPPMSRDVNANAVNLFNRFSTIVQNFAAITGEEMPNAQTISERLDQIEELLPRVRQALRDQRVIS